MGHTKVVVGNTTPAPPPIPPSRPPPINPSRPPPFLPHFQPRVDITPKSKPVKKPNHRRKGSSYHDGYAIGSSDCPKTKKKPKSVSRKGPEPSGQLSFSELMSDFLQKPLPFKAAQKRIGNSDERPPHG